MNLSGSPRPIQVALVAPTLDILGGQAVQADRLLEALKTVPEVDVKLLPINPRLPGHLHSLQRVKYLRTIVTSLAYWWQLARVVPKVDVLHVFSASYFSFVLAPTPALFAAALFRKPTILNYHSGEAADHLQRWGTTAIPTLRLASRIVVPSDYLVLIFREYGLDAVTIPNSFDMDQFRFRVREAPSPVFLSNRNFEAHYGVATVLRAFALIQLEIPDARLLVAGHGPEEASLRELVRTQGTNNVSFLGRIEPEEMARIYDEADIYLNASEIDNMPLSILEAQASGLPVVTSDAGGIPFIVRQERTALTVSPGDPEDLAAQALRLLSEPGLAKRLSEAGREEVEGKYTMSTALPLWISSYDQVLGNVVSR